MASDPQLVARARVPELCSLGITTAHLMTGFLVEWFRHHFSHAAWIENPALRTRLWKAVDSTNLLVESATRWDPRTTEKRPAVLVRRNDWDVEHRVLDDRLQGDMDLTGTDHYARLVTGSHTLFALSPNAAEAEILGMEVYRDLSGFGPPIRRMLDLLRFVPVRVGGPAQVEEARKTYAVPVTVAYAYMEHWVLQPHAPKLKRVVLSMFA